MLKAIAIDDEEPALDVLDAFCSRTELIELRRTFSRTWEASQYMEEQAVDLLFLDINMPAQTGIEFYQRLADAKASQPQPGVPITPNQPMVIFTTAYSEYAVEGFNLKAIDYLLKPFTYERFLQAVQKAHEYNQLHQQAVEAAPAYLLFRVDYGLVKVMLNEILFIEGLDNYLKIHLLQQRPVVVRLTMKAMLDKLPTSEFARVHRSYIISLAKVQSVRNKLITVGDEEIPLGSSYEIDFYAAFQQQSNSPQHLPGSPQTR